MTATNLTTSASMAMPHHFSSNKLIYALVGSMLLHMLLVMVIPKISFDAIVPPKILQIDMIKTPAPEKIMPAPEITPAKLEPTKIEPTKIKPAEIKPIAPIKEKDPINDPTPTSTPTTAPIVTEAPPKAVIAVDHADNAEPPVKVVPPPVAEPPPGPSLAELDEARNHYGHSLWSAIEKYKQYPRIAQMRGWQGEVVLELGLDGSGKLKSKKIIKSSGVEVLDKQALDMVEKAAPFPTPPEVLRGNSFSIKVPIPFKLEGV